MRVYITTRPRYDNENEVVVRFQHDTYADEDYAILTLEGFTKILELAQGWATDSLETILYDDADALIRDYLSSNPSPSRLKILEDEETKRRVGERVDKWGEEPESTTSTDLGFGSTVSEESKAAVNKYLEREYSKARKPRNRHQDLEKRIGEE
ncbi:hypothetical protein IJ096_01580 [Candidatus Saccharibacteria bacterium]|nr:hypothetical protein [Candidatus Saccharibacteria bacterium]